LCREEQRLCDSSCTWTGWTETTPAGACEPGAERFEQLDCSFGLYRRQTCSDTCDWTTEADACADGCGDAPRVTSWGDEVEVCIPAEPFIRGSLDAPDQQPIQTVYVSAYYIDRTTVTNRRYKACRDAGVCGDTYHPTTTARIDDPAFADHPVYQLSFANAEAFCAWDGGRRLLTEAEWEKAARGPAPRENRYTWDGTEWRCDLVLWAGCPGHTPTSTDTDPYTYYSTDSSYYGVWAMLSGGRTWTHDFYQADYYSVPESLIDPQGPVAGTHHVQRGQFRHSNLTITWREGDQADGAIRCGRGVGTP
jgi:formylglycine-generating enzyme required for sulfatase activity